MIKHCSGAGEMDQREEDSVLFEGTRVWFPVLKSSGLQLSVTSAPRVQHPPWVSMDTHILIHINK